MAIVDDFAKAILRQNGRKWPIFGVNPKKNNVDLSVSHIYRDQNNSRLVLCKKKLQKRRSEGENVRTFREAKLAVLHHFAKAMVRQNGSKWPICEVNFKE